MADDHRAIRAALDARLPPRIRVTHIVELAADAHTGEPRYRVTLGHTEVMESDLKTIEGWCDHIREDTVRLP